MIPSPLIAAVERLEELRVADVMNRRLVTVRESDTMPTVAATLREHDVSSAPVVDDQGRCVGMLSATDFVRREHAQSSTSSGPLSPIRTTLTADASGDWTPGPTAAEQDTASRYMSRGVQSIAPQRGVLTAAAIMATGHIHRLVVLEDDGRPVGVISTMDIIAAVLNTLAEAQTQATQETD